jgi:hypothetical protein
LLGLAFHAVAKLTYRAQVTLKRHADQLVSQLVERRLTL